jgi:1,3-beta-glucan synthase
MSGYAAGGGQGHYDDSYANQGHGDSYYQDEHAQAGYYDNQGYSQGDGYYDQAYVPLLERLYLDRNRS